MPSQIRVVLFVVGRRHQHVDVAADDLALFVAEQSFGGRVERFDAAVRIDHDDAVHRGIDDRPPSRLAGAQLVVEPHALGEIVEHAGELAFALDRHLADRQVERERAAVATTPGHFATGADDLRCAGVEILREIAVVRVVIRRRHEHVDVPTDDFGLGIAEQPLGPAVERFDSSLRVDDDDAIDRGIDDRSQPRIRVTEIRRARVHLRFQVLVRVTQRVGSLPLATGVAGDEPEDPRKESRGCHREGNRDQLKTAHRRLVQPARGRPADGSLPRASPAACGVRCPCLRVVRRHPLE